MEALSMISGLCSATSKHRANDRDALALGFAAQLSGGYTQRCMATTPARVIHCSDLRKLDEYLESLGTIER